LSKKCGRIEKEERELTRRRCENAQRVEIGKSNPVHAGGMERVMVGVDILE